VRLAPAFALACVLLLAGCAVDVQKPQDGVRYQAIKVDTKLGSFTAILFENETPLTAQFVRKLVEAKYYDGRAFGRVIPGFVIQEVDRTGGTTDQPEKVKGEFGTNVSFSAGALGIARDADPDSGGSEFFVMDFAYSSLHGNFTAFAQVVDGLEVVHAIARVPAVRTGPASSVGPPAALPVYFGVHDRVPVEPVVMTRVSIVTIELAPSEAARYPLRVGETVRADAWRATLEWPNDLRAGAASGLAYYVWARDASPAGSAKDPDPVDLKGAKIVVTGAGNATIDPIEDAKVPGILRFGWTPQAAGDYVVSLVKGGTTMAATNVTVPP
jgi:cyclophilin family peptidyl-prolyl cis-trans isomerase